MTKGVPAPAPSHVQKEVIERFTNLYGAPARDNPKAFLQEYREAFGKTAMPLLREGVTAAIKANRYSAWPTIGEISAHIREIGLWQASQRAREEVLKQSPWDAPRPPAEARARVQKLTEETLSVLRQANERGLHACHSVDREAWEARRFDLIWEGKCLNTQTFRRISARPIDGQGHGN